MRKRDVTLMMGLALAALLVTAVRANFDPIADPDAAYQSATTRLDVGDPDFSVVSSLSDATQTVTFDTDLVALTTPFTWGSWGSPPFTESATPRVLWTQGFTNLAMDLATPVVTFGFEAQPNPLGPSDIMASFFSMGSLIGSISLSVEGDAGARLFAAMTGTDPFDRIELSSTDDFAIANVRYAVTQVVPEPGSAVLFLLGGGIMVALRRRRQVPASG